jgi:autoinducer 2-degrading protein
MYVVTVEFEIVPGHEAEFLREMVANARASRERESGCRQFDVCIAPEQPRLIFLYEIYADRAAFETHVGTAHFRAFDATTAPWVARKTVRFYERRDPA